MLLRALTITGLIAAGVLATVLALKPAYVGVREGRADENYLPSRTCFKCHAENFASWVRTYHRTMTQEARPESVQGDFERDNTFEYLGVRARMEKCDGAFFMTFTMPDGRREEHRIARTVGSRRIEQYVTKQGDRYVRLPLAYDLVNRRWMSLNGSFFYPDGNDFFQHQAPWDPNCAFCHNVKAQPNYDWDRQTFDTELSEMGIACGACHGPAAEHAELAASPLTRARWRFLAGEDRRIVNPSKLEAERSLMVCGRCHGQRIPEPMDRIRQVMSHGDPFNAGEDLSRFFRPVGRDTKIGDFSFASRFWADGSPRLTAYEYQGLLRSGCFIRGEAGNRITCLSCHTMHGGDPKGQITEANRGNRPCLACHQEYETAEALVKHKGHAAESSGSRCYDCHMPRVVYGVMSIHPTHEITVPDPARTVSQAVPNACNQCHLDRSVNWAIREAKRMWPERYAGAEPSADEQFEQPEGARALFAGDALTRALAAEALGGGGPAKPDAGWAGPLLVQAFEDNYPIVRFFAANGLARIDSRLPKPDYLGTAAARAEALRVWRRRFAPESVDRVARLAAWLRERRIDVDIEVGE